MVKTLVGTPDDEPEDDDAYIDMIAQQLADEFVTKEEKVQIAPDEVIKLRAVIAELREVIALQRLLITLLLQNDELDEL